MKVSISKKRGWQGKKKNRVRKKGAWPAPARGKDTSFVGDQKVKSVKVWILGGQATQPRNDTWGGGHKERDDCFNDTGTVYGGGDKYILFKKKES